MEIIKTSIDNVLIIEPRVIIANKLQKFGVKGSNPYVRQNKIQIELNYNRI